MAEVGYNYSLSRLSKLSRLVARLIFLCCNMIVGDNTTMLDMLSQSVAIIGPNITEKMENQTWSEEFLKYFSSSQVQTFLRNPILFRILINPIFFQLRFIKNQKKRYAVPIINTSLAAKGALTYRLQHRTACKIQTG